MFNQGVQHCACPLLHGPFLLMELQPRDTVLAVIYLTYAPSFLAFCGLLKLGSIQSLAYMYSKYRSGRGLPPSPIAVLLDVWIPTASGNLPQEMEP